MKKDLIKIIAVFFIVVGIVFWGLNYIFLNQNGPKSRAAGETINLSFSPGTVSTTATNPDFTIKIVATPSKDAYIRGYETRINFNNNLLNLKSITYKLGSVSSGLGDTDNNLTAINGTGVIKVIGESQSPTGSLLTSAANANNENDLLILTFTVLDNSVPTSVTIGDSSFFSINADMTLFNGWTFVKDNLRVNVESTDPTLTPLPSVTPGGPTLTPTSIPPSVTPGGPSVTPTSIPPSVTPGGPSVTPTPIPPSVTPGGPTLTPTPIPPSVTPGGPSLTPTGGVTGAPILKFILKFQGIIKKPESGRDKISTTITVVKGNNKQKISDMMFVANDDGTWEANAPMVFDKITPGSGYHILVKGGKHLQKKICLSNPSETYPGTYHCDQGKITLKAGINYLDLSKILLLAGDLPQQDGIVNSYDTSLVYNNLGKSDAESIRLADINLDGIVDTQDYSLIISALSIRSDEGDDDTYPTTATATIGPSTLPATVGPTNPGATSTPAPVPTGPGATGDLLRDGSTYPIYTSISFINCQNVTSPVSSIALSLLGQSQTHNNTSLTWQVTKPLLIGDINVNDFLAQDLLRNDQEAHFGPTANISIQATGINNYLKNLNDADAYFSMSWCASSQGCLGVSEPDLQGKKFIHIESLRVCGY